MAQKDFERKFSIIISTNCFSFYRPFLVKFLLFDYGFHTQIFLKIIISYPLNYCFVSSTYNMYFKTKKVTAYFIFCLIYYTIGTRSFYLILIDCTMIFVTTSNISSIIACGSILLCIHIIPYFF